MKYDICEACKNERASDRERGNKGGKFVHIFSDLMAETNEIKLNL